MCNDWDWWGTLTIDKNKQDRSDLKAYRINFQAFIHKENKKLKRKGKEPIKYLLVAEKHKDGNWHMHGFLKNVPTVEKNEYGYWDWKDYAKNFGYISLSAIKDHERASSYITKYMTKDTQQLVTEIHEHMYVSSKGLNKPRTIKIGTPVEKAFPADWENEYVAVSMLRTSEQLTNCNNMITWDRQI